MIEIPKKLHKETLVVALVNCKSNELKSFDGIPLYQNYIGIKEITVEDRQRAVEKILYNEFWG